MSGVGTIPDDIEFINELVHYGYKQQISRIRFDGNLDINTVARFIIVQGGIVGKAKRDTIYLSASSFLQQFGFLKTMRSEKYKTHVHNFAVIVRLFSNKPISEHDFTPSAEKCRTFSHLMKKRQSKEKKSNKPPVQISSTVKITFKDLSNASTSTKKRISKNKKQEDFVQTKAFLDSYEWRKLRMEALKRYEGRCMCCGASPATGAVLNVDHIKPRKLFPELALVLDNLQVLCAECNHGKGNWDQTDWRPTE